MKRKVEINGREYFAETVQAISVFLARCEEMGAIQIMWNEPTLSRLATEQFETVLDELTHGPKRPEA